MASVAARSRDLSSWAVDRVPRPVRSTVRELRLTVVLLAGWWILSRGNTSFYFPPLSEIWVRFQEL